MITTITVDDLVEKFEWYPDFVKIDVEGTESLVLAGPSKLAQYQKTIFMVEMHSPPEMSMTENAGRVLEWCKKHRYTAWYMRDTVPLQLPEQLANRGKCHLLLLPKGEPYPSELASIKQGAELPSIT